jgi:hypothetical protein
MVKNSVVEESRNEPVSPECEPIDLGSAVEQTHGGFVGLATDGEGGWQYSA